MNRAKTCDYIVWQLCIKAGWPDAVVALRNLAEILGLKSSRKSRPVIVKLLTCHHKNLDISSRKSRPVIINISTVHNKISTCRYENIDLSS